MKRTNLVFILTDNQGAWTLGCYGNAEIRTPHLDSLAAGGMRFTDAYCVNSVCSPNRATYLTGLLPSQHGVHSYLGGEKPDAQLGPHAYCTIREFTTLPRLMAEAGYACGLSGKWHLGDSLRPQEGFTYWFAKPKGHTSTFYGDEAIWKGRIYSEPRYYTDAITGHALDFIEQNHARPFFLYVAYNGPYGLGEHMIRPHANRHAEYYADKELSCFPREPIHPWLKQNRQIVNNPISIRGYAAAVSGVDDGVGEIVAVLERHGLEEDTLLVFTADQGLCGGHHGMWGMGDHARPLHTFEETVHIPLLFRQRGRVPAGSVFTGRVGNYDLFPSVLEHLGMEDEVPRKPELPGRSYARALAGKETEGWDGTIFYEYENTRMVRSDRWKYAWRFPAGPDELYDMQADPGERNNLAGDPKYERVAAEMRGEIEAFFARYADPQYDLWRGGRSKAGRLAGVWPGEEDGK
jgi:arylsulfatase A-like enzyme